MPSPTGDIALWLHAIEIPDGAGDVVRLRMEPLAPIDAGGGVVVAAVTTFRGAASPLILEPRRTLRIDGERGAAGEVGVDLGQVFRERPAPPPLEAAGGAVRARSIGWGTPLVDQRAKRPRRSSTSR